MPNVLERASAIRMSGEPWQNAVQRATSQLRYEAQMGGAAAKKPRANKGKPLSAEHKAKIAAGRRGVHASTDKCRYSEKTQHCRLTTRGRKSPQYRPNKVTSQKLLDHREEFATRARANKGEGFKDAMARKYSGAQEGGMDLDMMGGAATKGKGKGKAKSPAKKKKARKAVRTDNCYQARKSPGRCRLSVHGRALHTNKKTDTQLSPEEAANRERFVRAAAAARGLPKGEYQRAFQAEFNRPAPGAAASARGPNTPEAQAKRAERAAKAAYRASPQAQADEDSALYESGPGYSRAKGSTKLRKGGRRRSPQANYYH